RKFRKPLVLFTPKALLRYEPSFSTLDELSAGEFQCVIDDPAARDRDRISRVLLCTGKVYYTLQAAREKSPDACQDCAIIRVEQLYPFPESEICAAVSRYPRAHEIGWVQEEPKNRGAWTVLDPRLRQMFPDALLSYF